MKQEGTNCRFECELGYKNLITIFVNNPKYQNIYIMLYVETKF